jgi:hypothetical protein
VSREGSAEGMGKERLSDRRLDRGGKVGDVTAESFNLIDENAQLCIVNPSNANIVGN